MTILFDLDGTLIDSTEAILESFHHSYDAHNLPRPQDSQIMAQVGHPLDVMYERIGIQDKELIIKMVSAYKDCYRLIATKKTVLLPFAKEAVHLASKYAKLAIVTTKTSQYSKILLQHFELIDYFEILIGREDVQNPKPNKEPIEKAIKFLKTDKKNCWMIGDTTMDMLCAKNANVKSIGIIGKYEAKETLQRYTDIIKTNALEAVEDIIDKL